MRDRLKALYELQLIDDQLDELEALRGDLPNNVKELQLKLSQLESSVDAKQAEIDESAAKRALNEADMEKFLENQKKYKAQLYSVKNNKEYDALTKSIDQADEEIKKREMENAALLERELAMKADIESVAPQCDEIKEELKAKEADLKTIIKSSEREELKIREDRVRVEAKVKKADLSKYLHIRKAKGGKAVVTIDRKACTGCHYVIPPQRQLEIRRMDKLFTCESCGRFIVPTDVADEVKQ
ncbi:MAG: C4-type zinc ribbon domain-containing protein [Ignavibacteria bacterium]|nr:C4-type zinc ribbon domain-containing protein [Ignavibacteria bacterium]